MMNLDTLPALAEPEYELPNRTLGGLFETQVELQPHKIALTTEYGNWTYLKLNEDVNQLARLLATDFNVKLGSRVAIVMERTIDRVKTILALVKLGACYIPISESLPSDRVRTIISNSSAKLILSDLATLNNKLWLKSSFNSKVSAGSKTSVLFIDSEEVSLSLSNQPNSNCAISEIPKETIAHIIFTSGSTGKPKGVLGTYQATYNRVAWMMTSLPLGKNEVMAHLGSMAFIRSVWELFVPLCSGVRLVLCSRLLTRQVDSLRLRLYDEQVTRIVVTPSLMGAMTELQISSPLESSLEYLFVCGDLLRLKSAHDYLKEHPKVKLYNFYGSTEVMSNVLYSKVMLSDKGNYAPVGKAISGVNVVVINAQGEQLPHGDVGELLVYGKSVAAGYIGGTNHDNLRFINTSEGRAFRTGDIAKIGSDGRVICLGRMDDQIQIRGYRVESGEIEHVLLGLKFIKKAVVVAREFVPGDKRLVAYVVCQKSNVAENEIRQIKQSLLNECQRKLPDYMIPTMISILEEIPLSANGKIDRSALPNPTEIDSISKFKPVEGKTEQLLADLWIGVLGLSLVGRHEDFFAIGGHSLLAIQLSTRIQRNFAVELSVKTLFNCRTICEQAVFIERSLDSEQKTYIPIKMSRQSSTTPLSFSQQRLWFLNEYMGPNCVYNMSFAVRLKGSVNGDAILQSLKDIVARHDALRTRFEQKKGRPVQLVEQSELELTIEKVSGFSQIRDINRLEQNYRFDLSKDNLCRIRLLLDESNSSYVILVIVHHSIFDGWSKSIFIQELCEFYKAIVSNGPSPFVPLDIQYPDYTLWQRDWLQGEVLEKQLNYWRNQLKDLPPLLTLPTDRPRPLKQTFKGRKQHFILQPALASQIQELSQKHGVTLFMTLISGFFVLLNKYSGQEDIAVGTPVANRVRPETESLIGCFVNTLVMRGDFSGDPSFISLIEQLRNASIDAYTNQDVPFEKVVDDLEPERSLSYSPLFQVMFTLLNSPVKSQQLDDIELSEIDFTKVNNLNESELVEEQRKEEGISRFDLTVSVEESPNGIIGSIEYNTGLFNQDTIERFAVHYERLMKALVSQPATKISGINFITNLEMHRQLVESQGQSLEYSLKSSMHSLFEEKVKDIPDSVAIVFNDQHITYKELNERANKLANSLIAKGVGVEHRVGVCLVRSIEMVIGLLGVLKSGGCYVPLDPHYPEERLAFLIEDSEIELIITHSSLQVISTMDESSKSDLTLINIDLETNHYPSRNPAINLDSSNLAYIIYTSGSTGKPKGVGIQHQSVVSLLSWAADELGFVDSHSVLASTSMCFDLSIYELFLPLSYGGECLLIDNILSVELMPQKDRVTLINTVPSAAKVLLEKEISMPSLRIVNLAGEPLKAGLVDELYQATTVESVYDLYGPSEDTTYSTFIKRKVKGKESIGRPIANSQAYILDVYGKLTPYGVIGELYLGGDGLARGYIDRPSLTAERFVPNPFSQEPGKRLYRTGDLVRYLSDGKLEYVGRADQQVKLRGFRIELGEIESVFLNHQKVKDTVVIVRKDDSTDEQLVGYVVPSQRSLTDKDNSSDISKRNRMLVKELRISARAKLPAHMVPNLIVVIKELPLTANGKLDRSRLPVPDRKSDVSNYKAPEGITEELLESIWCDVLKIDRVGRDNNFFELGGHSLLATQLASRILDAFSVELSIACLFEQKTILEQASAIESAQKNWKKEILPITRVSRKQPLLLSYAQQRLWFLDKYMGASPVYNIPMEMHLVGEVHVDALKKSLEEIICRHEVLRTRFQERGNSAIQIIDPPSLTLHLEPLNTRDQLDSIRQSERNYLFNLSAEHLCRFRLLRDFIDKEHDETAKYILLVTMHHSVSDGWSLGIFERELKLLYNAFKLNKSSPLEPLPIQYVDYAHWQRQWLQDEVLEQQLYYWREKLSALPTLLNLPTDRQRPSEQSYKGNIESIVLPLELSKQLQQLSRTNGVTLYMTLLSAFSILLSRYSGQTDIAIGSPIANRRRQETESLIGFFVNSLVMRTDLSSSPNFETLLKQTRKTALEAYSHQDIPFEQLVEELNPERSLSHSPLFQVMFAFQNVPVNSDASEASDSAIQKQIEKVAKAGVARFDLTLMMYEKPEGLVGVMEYNTDLFDKSTVKRLLIHFGALLQAIVEQPLVSVSCLEFLSEDDRAQQLARPRRNSNNDSGQHTIQSSFERQVEISPHKVALIHKSKHLSYLELNIQADRLSSQLIELGLRPESRVGIYLEKSAELAVWILAILKAGSGYLYLDPNTPSLHMSYLIEQSEIEFLACKDKLDFDRLTKSVSYYEGFSHVVEFVQISGDKKTYCGSGIELKGTLPIFSNLACIMYGVSSHGKIRANCLTHEYLQNMLFNEELFAAAIAGLSATSISDDIFSFELLRAVVMGNTCTIKDEILHTPTLIQKRVEQNTHVRSFTNLEFYILDAYGQMVPHGVVGELYIAEPTLSRGFLNQASLTAEYFIPNQYGKVLGGRLYRTKKLMRHIDVGYVKPAELVSYPQNKRWNARETERLLERHNAVNVVKLVSQKQHVDEFIYCYLVLDEKEDQLHGQSQILEELKKYIKEQDQVYRLPDAFMVLDELPILSNGSVDFDKLPLWEKEIVDKVDYVAPFNDTQKELVALWQEKLDLKPIGINDNYFVLGGDSIRSIGLVASANQVGLNFSVKDLFAYPSIRLLSEAIDKGGLESSEYRVIEPFSLLDRDEVASLYKQYGKESLDDAYPLTMLQHGMVMLALKQRDLNVYQNIHVYQFNGRWNSTLFEQALNYLMKKHPMLRSIFHITEERPLQLILKESSPALTVIDLRSVEEISIDSTLINWQEKEQLEGLDITKELWRLTVYVLPRNKFLFCMFIHHAHWDGWSFESFVTELYATYSRLQTQRVLPESEKLPSYSQFIMLEQNAINSPEHIDYWTNNKLVGANLPWWTGRRKSKSAYIRRQVSTDMSRKISELASTLDVQEKSVWCSIYLALLALINGSDEFLVTVATQGRPEIPSGDKMVGVFLNILPFRAVTSGFCWNDFIQRTDKELRGQHEFRRYPLAEIQRITGVELSGAVFNYTNWHVYYEGMNKGGITKSLVPNKVKGQQETNYSLLFDAYKDERTQQFKMKISLDSELFDEQYRNRILGYVDRILSQIVTNASRMIDNRSLLGADEVERLLSVSQTRESLNEEHKFVHQWFESVSEKRPNDIAVINSGVDSCSEKLSYKELNERSNQLAHSLLDCGLSQDSCVGICIEQSLDWVIAILASLKFGGRFIMLDDRLPLLKLINVIDEGRVDVLLANDGKKLSAIQELLSLKIEKNTQRQYILFNQILIQSRESHNPNIDIHPLNAAQLIHPNTNADSHNYYTISHQCMRSLVNGECIDFDSNRAKLLPIPPGIAGNIFKMFRSILTIGSFVIEKDIPNFEQLTVSPENPLTLGLPQVNAETYILDNDAQIVALGAAGELCIGGTYLAREYFNQPILSAEKFIPNPFSHNLGERLYRTGNLVRFLSDGNLEYLGRVGHQTAVQPSRNAFDDMSRVVTQHEQIKEAILVPAVGTTSSGIVCYYVPNRMLDSIELKTLNHNLIRKLKSFEKLIKLPQAFVRLDALPRLNNGKIDRSKLISPNLSSQKVDFISPEGTTEELLANFWGRLLNCDIVGRNDDFFLLGGHSLVATQLVSWIRDAFAIEISIGDLFENKTLREQARVINETQREISGVSMPIIPSAINQPLLLSHAQQRLWFLNGYIGPNSVYNMPFVYKVPKYTNTVILIKALKELYLRHDSLRTRFKSTEGQVFQVIDTNSIDLELEVINSDVELKSIFNQERLYHFDLSQENLCRIRLLQLESNESKESSEFILLVTMHHIISDGWSIGIFFKELSILYKCFLNNQTPPLEPLTLQYVDFAQWQRKWCEGSANEKQLSYWKKKLDGLPPLLKLPTDRPRPIRQSYHGSVEKITISPSILTGLKELAKENDATLYMTMLAAFSVLMSRYSGQKDFAIGTLLAGRNRKEIENIIGFFVNSLVMRCDLSQDPCFIDLLKSTREICLQAYANQDIPFEQLVEELRPERTLSHSPLFQVMFTLQNMPVDIESLPGLNLQPLKLSQGNFGDNVKGVSRFDLSFNLSETSQGIRGEVEYNTDLFDVATIKRLVNHYEKVLCEIVKMPGLPVSQIQFLLEEEREQQICLWNNSQKDFPSRNCIIDLFEQQVTKCGIASALFFEQEHLNYDQLNSKANQLAHHLIELGVGPDIPVGICVERSLDMVVGLLAVLKAGGCYVPLDPNYPKERLEYIVENSCVELIITQPGVLRTLRKTNLFSKNSKCMSPNKKMSSVVLDENNNDWLQAYETNNPKVVIQATNLAYVIYTSGSTGKPKGVRVTHKNVVNFLSSVASQPGINSEDRLLAVTTLSFDIAVLELYLPLTVGASVDVANQECLTSGEKLGRRISENAITMLQATPITWKMLLEDGWQGNVNLKALVGGEAVSAELARELTPRVRELWNMYGPTETTVWSSMQQLSAPIESISIGRPLNNTEFYVLDYHQLICPIGVPGELFISGEGVSQGYFQRPGQTSQRFVPNPFNGKSGDRLYQTGDLVRYLADGRLEYIGRIDHQVKVRGFRIELGEIESVLRQHDAVKESVVVVTDEKRGKKDLVAYIVSNKDVDSDRKEKDLTDELRIQAQMHLPNYMVPIAFVVLDSLPLTANGKLDRASLSRFEVSGQEVDYIAPEGINEELLSGIWRDLLGIEQVGRKDNFFALGGHSLLATQLLSRIRNIFSVELSIQDLFEQQTIQAQARVIGLSNTDAKVHIPITLVSREKPLALSYAQQRMWFLNEYAGANAIYNMPLALRLKGKLNTDALIESINQIVRRHEVLRTRFEALEENVIQIIGSPGIKVSVESFDCERNLQECCDAERNYPFDLSQDKLCRIRLLRDESNAESISHVLLVTMHHSVSDGWSLGIFYRELMSLYQSYLSNKDSPLEELLVQYADYAQWQRNWLQGDILDRQVTYWQKYLVDAPPLLNLPTDRPRPLKQSFRGGSVSMSLTSDLTSGLHKLSRSEDVTLFMTLISAFFVLMSRYSGQKDLVVGTPIANRTRQETEKLIGFFVNTLVIRSDLNQDPNFIELLKLTRESALQSYAHQDIPFEQLVDELSPERNLSYSPLFQVMFALQNMPIENIILKNLEVSPLKFKNRSDKSEDGVSRFDLTLTMQDNPQGLIAHMEYNKDLFDQCTIESMLGHYQVLLEAIVQAPETKVSKLTYLTNRELEQQLIQWNSTKSNYPYSRCIHELFENKAKEIPTSIALADESAQISYAELNYRSNQLAHYFMKRGIGPEDRVGICFMRSIDMVVTILGVLKAGAAYVPIVHNYPKARVKYIINNSGIKLLVTQEKLGEMFADYKIPLFLFDSQNNQSVLLEQPCSNIKKQGLGLTADSLCYIIYTSGSTGQPKGVMGVHRGIVNRVNWLNNSIRMSVNDVVGQKTSLGFVDHVAEIFQALSFGASLVIIPEESIQGVTSLGEILEQWRVSHITLVPSLLEVLLESGELIAPKLKVVHTSGEPVNLANLSNFQYSFPRARLFNIYGATEISADVTSCELTSQDKILVEGSVSLIGKAIDNTQTYVLDQNGLSVAVGVIGQLYVGGDALARGYLARPGQTAAHFLPNPHSQSAGERLYCTGDLVRYRANGSLDYLGRADHQVKIRGHRIELGEIEQALSKFSQVQSAIVLTNEGAGGSNQLVAYVVFNNSNVMKKSYEVTEMLRKHLKQEIPNYMIPSVFIELKKFPLTTNGKVDRLNLPNPEVSLESSIYVEPVGDTEKQMAIIWIDVLKSEKVGRFDNFFEMGGHSLLAMQIVSRVCKAFEIEFKLEKLFEYPTLNDLCSYIDSERKISTFDENDINSMTEEEAVALLNLLENE